MYSPWRHKYDIPNKYNLYRDICQNLTFERRKCLLSIIYLKQMLVVQFFYFKSIKFG